MILQSAFNSKDGKRTLGKEDVKKIKKWRRENPDISISDCIEKVLKLKPVTITTHIAVCDMNENIQRLVECDSNYKEKLLAILESQINGTFHSIDVGKSVIAISMDDRAYREFYNSQYNNGVSYTRFLDQLLEDKIG